MNKVRLLYSALVIVFGVAMVIYGGYDDSPGGQLLGLLAVILGIVGIVKSKKQKAV
jgi:drug/metabolite transporter (DMT)-like permease